MFIPQSISNGMIFVQLVAYVAGTGNNAARFKSVSSDTLVVRQTRVAGIPIRRIGGIKLSEPNDIKTILPTALELQSRLRSRWPAIMARAQELQKTNPDPVQSIVDLLSSLPGDYTTWREIIEEPYG